MTTTPSLCIIGGNIRLQHDPALRVIDRKVRWICRQCGQEIALPEAEARK